MYMRDIKKGVLLILFALLYFTIPIDAQAATITQRLSGNFVIDVENNGEAWYVHPKQLQRYYLGRPKDAFRVMQKHGRGITNTDLQRIPTADAPWDGDQKLMRYVRGSILLQVQEHGEAWYVHPQNGKRYYLGTPKDAFALMKQFGIGITAHDLSQIPTTAIALPSQHILSVPFTAQAPTGNWGSPFDEACEEASIIMVDRFLRSGSMDASTVQQEIERIVAWEQSHFGNHEDTSIADTARVAEELYGYKATISSTVTAQQIKKFISRGNPVIIPVFGRALNNPHYRAPGPLYHMVVIVGYEGEDFIIHDPGTRFGKAMRFNSSTVLSAIHDLTNPESSIAQGTPRILVLKK